MSKTIAKIKGLKLNFYTYEGVVQALDGVNLEIKQGEILGVVGETGSGKSVSSFSILAIVPPPGKIENGHVFFELDEGPIDVLQQRDSYLRQFRGDAVSMVFQEPRAALNPIFTVDDQISETILLHRKREMCERALEQLDRELQGETPKTIKEGRRKKPNPLRRLILKRQKKIYERMLAKPNSLAMDVLTSIPIVRRIRNRLKREARKEVVKILTDMRIPDPERVADMYPHELSGGMAQRVIIAIALSCRPILLIADEPTTNLDVTVQAQILELIKELRSKFKSTILYITHDMGVIAETCDRVAVMYAGSVAEVADVVEIFKNPLHPYTSALLESIPRPGKKFVSIEGTVPSLIDPPKGCRFHTRCKYAMDICSLTKPKFVETKPGHSVLCYLYTKEAD